jgi:cyclophilin family peptidyl-prolyl cis-trans isomerase
VIDRLRRDPSPLVRVELARAIAQPSAAACELAALLVADEHVHVRLMALDATAKACVGAPQAPQVARELGRHAGDAAADWRVRAHALTAWARLEGPAAAAVVPRAASAAQWQERMYAARAATTLRDVTTLDRLASDEAANVREAALGGLVTIEAPSVERTALAALASDDYQLLRTAAAALAKARERRVAADALLTALARVSRHERDTARDPRQAMLEALREVGSIEDSARVEPYTTDADPVIAALAAAILTKWTGHPVSATPRPRAHRRPVPTMDDLRRLARASATMRLAGLGDIEFRLLAFDAPTNVARFVEQARPGFFTGLTWHRVEPNFVLQGGSPGANEYSAQGAYANDEITSASHVRGTIGISTRGRDTGDGQLFINLADNIRLDHNFTIIGEVVRGFDVMDAIVEGTTIEAVNVVLDR